MCGCQALPHSHALPHLEEQLRLQTLLPLNHLTCCQALPLPLTLPPPAPPYETSTQIADACGIDHCEKKRVEAQAVWLLSQLSPVCVAQAVACD